jgi:hypothetical protein
MVMLLRIAAILLVWTVALAGSVAAQPTTGPSAITRTVIAATATTVTDVPLYFRALNITIPAGEKTGMSAV